MDGDWSIDSQSNKNSSSVKRNESLFQKFLYMKSDLVCFLLFFFLCVGMSFLPKLFRKVFRRRKHLTPKPHRDDDDSAEFYAQIYACRNGLSINEVDIASFEHSLEALAARSIPAVGLDSDPLAGSSPAVGLKVLSTELGLSNELEATKEELAATKAKLVAAEAELVPTKAKLAVAEVMLVPTKADLAAAERRNEALFRKLEEMVLELDGTRGELISATARLDEHRYIFIRTLSRVNGRQPQPSSE